MVEDAIKSIKAILYERATSPLLGAFFASWLVSNYKLVLVLFSSMEVTRKFTFIENELYPTIFCSVWHLLVLPATGAIFLIFVYPFPAKYVYEFWRKQQKQLKEIKQRIEDETPLTIEESRELRKKYDSLVGHYELIIESKDREINELNEILQKKENAISDKERLIQDIQISRVDSKSEGYEDKISILKTLSESTPLTENEIIEKSELERGKGLYEIGELAEIGLIQRVNYDKNDCYQISQRGRRELAKSGNL